MRADVYLCAKGYYKSRNKAGEAIKREEVFLNGKLLKKASQEVLSGDEIEIKAESEPFVSLGGDKLEKAMREFNPEVEGLIFVDAGASTGGFTDCLLRRGAKKVFCVDVGKALLDEKISSDKRVVVMDETNVRFLKPADFGEEIDAAVADCSFISLEYVLPVLKTVVKKGGYIIALIKPQFELDKKIRLKNGVLRDKKERLSILKRTYEFIERGGMSVLGITEAPVYEDKNVEYLAYISTIGGKSAGLENVLKNRI